MVSLGLALMDAWGESPHFLTEISLYQKKVCGHTGKTRFPRTLSFQPKTFGSVNHMHKSRPPTTSNVGSIAIALEVTVLVYIPSTTESMVAIISQRQLVSLGGCRSSRCIKAKAKDP